MFQDTKGQTPENPPAFPIPPGNPLDFPGMSLRDWFAGQALIGAVAGAVGLGQADPKQLDKILSEMAVLLYKISYAMLKERAKEE